MMSNRRRLPDLSPSVGEGDGTRTRARARVRSAHLPTPLAYGLRIPTQSGYSRRMHEGGE
jgi:hypothetical protein